MRVAELGAGGGYTTELLARAVGPTGTVYAQNNRLILDRFAEKPWSARLTRPVMANVVRVDREFDDPLPPAASNLDAGVIILFYHDLFWMGADRGRRSRRFIASTSRWCATRSSAQDSSSSGRPTSCAILPTRGTGTIRRAARESGAGPAIDSCWRS